jgi:hypothetical protein
MSSTEKEKEAPYDPFFNVRKGGPKEKRLFHVALMGEFNTIPPVYWIRVNQTEGAEYISNEILKEEFCSYGEITQCYRPENPDNGEPRPFALVGFSHPDPRDQALAEKKSSIDGNAITIQLAKDWFVDLYPKPGESLLDRL